MASAKDIAGKLVALAAVAAGGLAIYNVTSDPAPVLKSARLALACPSEAACQVSRYDRKPWEIRYEIFNGADGKVVRCSPAFLLVGEWKCRATDERAAPPVRVR